VASGERAADRLGLPLPVKPRPMSGFDPASALVVHDSRAKLCGAAYNHAKPFSNQSSVAIIPAYDETDHSVGRHRD
jgi:hypothetical protein